MLYLISSKRATSHSFYLYLIWRSGSRPLHPPLPNSLPAPSIRVWSVHECPSYPTSDPTSISTLGLDKRPSLPYPTSISTQGLGLDKCPSLPYPTSISSQGLNKRPSLLYLTLPVSRLKVWISTPPYLTLPVSQLNVWVWISTPPYLTLPVSWLKVWISAPP